MARATCFTSGSCAWVKSPNTSESKCWHTHGPNLVHSLGRLTLILAAIAHASQLCCLLWQVDLQRLWLFVLTPMGAAPSIRRVSPLLATTSTSSGDSHPAPTRMYRVGTREHTYKRLLGRPTLPHLAAILGPNGIGLAHSETHTMKLLKRLAEKAQAKGLHNNVAEALGYDSDAHALFATFLQRWKLHRAILMAALVRYPSTAMTRGDIEHMVRVLVSRVRALSPDDPNPFKSTPIPNPDASGVSWRNIFWFMTSDQAAPLKPDEFEWAFAFMSNLTPAERFHFYVMITGDYDNSVHERVLDSWYPLAADGYFPDLPDPLVDPGDTVPREDSP